MAVRTLHKMYFQARVHTHTHAVVHSPQHFCQKQASALFTVNDFSFVELSVKMCLSKKKLISCSASVNHNGLRAGLKLTVFIGGDSQNKGNVP